MMFLGGSESEFLSFKFFTSGSLTYFVLIVSRLEDFCLFIGLTSLSVSVGFTHDKNSYSSKEELRMRSFRKREKDLQFHTSPKNKEV